MSSHTTPDQAKDLRRIESMIQDLCLRLDDHHQLSVQRLLNKQDAANYLGIAVRTLDKKVASGEIPTTDITSRRMFDRMALDAIIRSKTKYETRNRDRHPIRRVRK